jgi:hypothetical protein
VASPRRGRSLRRCSPPAHSDPGRQARLEHRHPTTQRRRSPVEPELRVVHHRSATSRTPRCRNSGGSPRLTLARIPRSCSGGLLQLALVRLPRSRPSLAWTATLDTSCTPRSPGTRDGRHARTGTAPSSRPTLAYVTTLATGTHATACAGAWAPRLARVCPTRAPELGMGATLGTSGTSRSRPEPGMGAMLDSSCTPTFLPELGMCATLGTGTAPPSRPNLACVTTLATGAHPTLAPEPE